MKAIQLHSTFNFWRRLEESFKKVPTLTYII